MYVDTLVVPAKSRLADQAWRFIEFMSRPDIAYLNTEQVLYNSPYKSVTRSLLANHGDETGWHNLRAIDSGKGISVLSVDSQSEEVAAAWARFVGSKLSTARTCGRRSIKACRNARCSRAEGRSASAPCQFIQMAKNFWRASSSVAPQLDSLASCRGSSSRLQERAAGPPGRRGPARHACGP